MHPHILGVVDLFARQVLVCALALVCFGTDMRGIAGSGSGVRSGNGV